MAEGDALAVRGLSKTYDGLKAVDALSLTVRRGEVYGFLGPNGAGKTTTIKMMLGLTSPDGGTVRINGEDLSRNPHEIKRRIGFVPERLAFYPNLTARQTLQFYADLKRVGYDGLADLLAAVGLRPFADKKVGTFSKGMVQLLGVAQAMVGEPNLLILDEPTAGLDPNWTRAVKDRIRAMNDAGATVFFSSHILGEVQELADRVGILDRGVLVAEDTVDALGQELNMKPRLRLFVDAPLEAVSEAIEGVEGVHGVVAEGTDIVIACDHAAKVRVLARVEAAGIAVKDFRTEEPSLEEVFLRLTESSRGSVR